MKLIAITALLMALVNFLMAFYKDFFTNLVFSQVLACIVVLIEGILYVPVLALNSIL